MHEFHSAIVQKDRLLPGIHGLRGVAALAVVLFHLNHLAGITPPVFFEFIGRDFGYSVHLFFIISAFSLCYSTGSRTDQPKWLSEYFLKRFFRIAPLFYFMIVFEITRQIVSAGKVITDFNSIILEMTFTFGFVQFSDFIWGGWTVGVEMIFYAIFPVLVLTIRTCRSALVLLVISIIICYAIRSSLHLQYIALTPQSKWDWSYFAPASNLCFFAMGLFAYHISRQYKESNRIIRIIQCLAIIIIGGLTFLNIGKYFFGDGRLDIVIWGLGLMALCISQSVSPSLFIANQLFEHLGERSFSIYLLHPVVITFSKVYLVEIYGRLLPYIGSNAFFVCAILTIALTLAFAELTYRIIEVPGISFGRKLIIKRRFT
jgi:peptidoglycan/LPS O-acetylase OafA/YrhL